MDNRRIAHELFSVAKVLLAFEFNTKDELHKYLKEHPDADKGNHWVKKQGPKGKKKDLKQKIKKVIRDDPKVKEKLEGVVQGHQTKTPEFKKWFGDSKAVDESGKPLVVFHGTDKNFTKFDPDQTGTRNVPHKAGTAFYFTSDESVAKDYAKGWTDSKDAIVMSVYLQMKNPLEVDLEGKDDFSLKGYIEQAKSEGFDGVIAKNTDDGGVDGKLVDQYIVFDPKQIKSATGNDGTFDAGNPDIRKSEGS